MLDSKFIRENKELVKENIQKKNKDTSIVDSFLELDEKRKEYLQNSQNLRKERNDLSSQINQKKKAGEDASELLQKVKEIPQKIKQLDESLENIEKELYSLQLKIPNIMHPSVPLGKDDSENVELRRVGEPIDKEIKNHVELLEERGLADFESAARVAGNGFYYLEGDLALLNQALISFAIKEMTLRGFKYVETPLMLREEIIDQVTDLNDKAEQIYMINSEPMALIGTSEHSLIGRYAKQVIDKKELPIKQTSYSMCFRKEVGSHGIDEKGLFRTHQFNKIEMIIICEPEDSMKYYEEMQNITLDIFKKLGIPVRVLGICSGDLGDLKHIQVDIEAYSPRRKEYFEVGSCSNLTESQARKLNIKVFDGKERYYPHTLNNTAIATSRALVAILENNQNPDGTITVPEVLRSYLGKDKI